MKLTPLDVKHVHFSRSALGYSPKEVRAFLDHVREELQYQIAQNNEKEEEIKILETLLEETRKQAKPPIESEKRTEVELKLESLIKRSQERLMTLAAEINEMKRQKAQFKSDLSAVIKSHLRFLELHDELDRPQRHEAHL